ncbi:GNAT family N-acetyltransferase [Chitinophaga sp. SYP-B3965]|uniref:GNAT family N-acetyltransferase n=1 Tax=Chitinophaga sp. SYP-B3965 TaxID=2663120 RepID=UPI001299EFCC|nr:GNAT family N-acetyltransferase [Chitinophaga sp. SYP-B3965]MRG48362.1 GNAT family N-acetyltransferase [Chitinophaga sp. SYP-B3965]
MFSALDNPAWHALNSKHQEFAIGTALAKRYSPDIVSFVAFANMHAASLDPFIQTGESFFIIGALPSLPPNWEILNELVCLQMICQQVIDVEASSIHALSETDQQEMFSLVTKVQPGYYLPGTQRMGNYFGIRQDEQLVAMAGERMRLDGLTELSAIVTLPEFAGRKYARHLITHLVNRNLAAGIIPFLHVSESNERAIGLYERLGFVTRRKISFWLIKKRTAL